MSETNTYTAPPVQTKWLLNTQVWLLRHRLMGPMGRQIMVITTTGRKSGKPYSVPIGFVRDGESILTFNIGGHSNWIRNVRVHPRVTLNIQGHEFAALGHEEPAATPEQVRAILRVYQREAPSQSARFFKANADSSDEDLLRVGREIQFMRFTPANS